ncbi:MAG TPA: ATP-binding protein [Gemmataceae bacterium]|nr:ATP-binding protein [Gemmataceae bacterium]
MRQFLLGRYARPFVTLGGLVAVACLASIWYINRLQSDMARTVRHDVAQMEAADELQLRLRQLRFHSLMAAADPSESRRKLVDDDRQQVAAALAAARRECDTEGDLQLLTTIEHGYREYEAGLAADLVTGPSGRTADKLIRWADAHPVRGLLVPCRELEDRQRDQMNQSLKRSEAQTTWAGRVLLGLGLTGALGGLLSGYATARGLTRRAARLSVRVQAVQAQLDQEVGAMTIEAIQPPGDLDAQLDRVVGRVKEVCRRLQEQERDLLRAEQLAAVGHLAAGVAHEIRNPLTGIKFLIEGALRPANPTPLTAEDLRLIHHEIVRIGRTVQGLLDFARTPPPDCRRHDLRELVSEAAGIARGRAEAKGVSLRLLTPPDPVPAAVDRDQILSLLTNLLFNAIDAAPPGGEIGLRADLVERGLIRVEVTDTGPGIDPAVAERLFRPFTTTKPTGTGLGLTIARRVAMDHGGTLTAANRPEGGACFTLILAAAGESHVEAPGR